MTKITNKFLTLLLIGFSGFYSDLKSAQTLVDRDYSKLLHNISEDQIAVIIKNFFATFDHSSPQALCEALNDFFKLKLVSKNFKNIVNEIDKVGKINVNLADAFGNTPLHIAAQRGYIQVVKFLIARGANSNALSSQGFAKENHPTINIINDFRGKKINHKSLIEKISKIIKLENDAIPRIAYVGWTPLADAILNNNIEIINLLLPISDRTMLLRASIIIGNEYQFNRRYFLIDSMRPQAVYQDSAVVATPEVIKLMQEGTLTGFPLTNINLICDYASDLSEYWDLF